jgi:murein DD-endopeptidase MepM/ murein hydrolase activator NlpD
MSTRLLAPALVLLLALASATPAWSEPSGTPEARRDAARTKKAKVAAELNTLKASDDELESAVRALDAGVAVQENATEAAQRALKSAESGLNAAEERLATTEKRMTELRARASQAAVRAYVHPGGDPFLDIVRSRDLSEASRRQALLSSMVSSDRDVLDQMRSARQDQQFDKANLTNARNVAEERRKSAEGRLAELQAARDQQGRLKSALDSRISEYVSEVDSLSREEATLTALLKARAAAAATSPEAASGGGGRVSGTGLIWPVSGPVTSGFGVRWGRLHAGIDIAPGYGTPVKAAKAGTVIMAGSNGGYGNCVIIDHGGGLSTLYGHMSKITVGDGESVKQGEQVGNVGSTGSSTGPHLHFETRINGSPQNPMRYLP